MRRVLVALGGSCVLIVALGGGAHAESTLVAQYYGPGYPPPGYGYRPPCQAVTPGPFGGAARGAARGALTGAIFEKAGRARRSDSPGGHSRT